ncbi:MAG: hypothetical protein HY858_14480 [Candidatus Solibacter usitatus]|nr:hypothetical protein [Candidatus Solibacter usitatus]
MSLRFQFGRLRLVVLAVVILTLAPLSPAFIPLLARAGDSCGMSCCKRMKSCCCRNAGRLAAHSTAPQWQPLAGCSRNCRQSAALLPVIPGMSSSPHSGILPEAARVARRVRANSAPGVHGVDFALFERPPPSLS